MSPATDTLTRLHHARDIIDRAARELAEAQAGERSLHTFRLVRKQRRISEGSVDAAYILELSGGYVLVVYLHDPFGFMVLRSMTSAYAALGDSYLMILDDTVLQTHRKHVSDSVNITAADRQLLRLLRRGFHHAEIAREMGVAVSTAKGRASTLYRKLGVDSRFAALSATYSWNLDEPSGEDEPAASQS